MYEAYKYSNSRFRDIPWNWFNLTKMLVTFVLMCMSWIDLGMVVTFKEEQGLFDVQIVTAVLNAVSYVSCTVIYLLAKLKQDRFPESNACATLLSTTIRDSKFGNDLHLLVHANVLWNHSAAY